MNDELDPLIARAANLRGAESMRLGSSLAGALDSSARDDFLASFLKGLPSDDVVASVVKSTQSLPKAEQVAAVAQSAAGMDAREKQQVLRELRGLSPPRNTSGLWSIVISSFAIVLVGSFLVISWTAISPQPNPEAKPELVLSMFTSVVGFLAGIFVPTPGRT